ncbi:MAG TPA: hypothetical protein VJZ78_08365 [Anaerolineales bacterium]|nr:hypothetical protein [Anaerolineales bacterium]
MQRIHRLVLAYLVVWRFFSNDTIMRMTLNQSGICVAPDVGFGVQIFQWSHACITHA